MGVGIKLPLYRSGKKLLYPDKKTLTNPFPMSPTGGVQARFSPGGNYMMTEAGILLRWNASNRKFEHYYDFRPLEVARSVSMGAFAVSQNAAYVVRGNYVYRRTSDEDAPTVAYVSDAELFAPTSGYYSSNSCGNTQMSADGLTIVTTSYYNYYEEDEESGTTSYGYRYIRAYRKIGAVWKDNVLLASSRIGDGGIRSDQLLSNYLALGLSPDGSKVVFGSFHGTAYYRFAALATSGSNLTATLQSQFNTAAVGGSRRWSVTWSDDSAHCAVGDLLFHTPAEGNPTQIAIAGYTPHYVADSGANLVGGVFFEDSELPSRTLVWMGLANGKHLSLCRIDTPSSASILEHNTDILPECAVFHYTYCKISVSQDKKCLVIAALDAGNAPLVYEVPDLRTLRWKALQKYLGVDGIESAVDKGRYFVAGKALVEWDSKKSRYMYRRFAGEENPVAVSPDGDVVYTLQMTASYGNGYYYKYRCLLTSKKHGVLLDAGTPEWISPPPAYGMSPLGDVSTPVGGFRVAAPSVTPISNYRPGMYYSFDGKIAVDTAEIDYANQPANILRIFDTSTTTYVQIPFAYSGDMVMHAARTWRTTTQNRPTILPRLFGGKYVVCVPYLPAAGDYYNYATQMSMRIVLIDAATLVATEYTGPGVVWTGYLMTDKDCKYWWGNPYVYHVGPGASIGEQTNRFRYGCIHTDASGNFAGFSMLFEQFKNNPTARYAGIPFDVIPISETYCLSHKVPDTDLVMSVGTKFYPATGWPTQNRIEPIAAPFLQAISRDFAP